MSGTVMVVAVNRREKTAAGRSRRESESAAQIQIEQWERMAEWQQSRRRYRGRVRKNTRESTIVLFDGRIQRGLRTRDFRRLLLCGGGRWLRARVCLLRLECDGLGLALRFDLEGNMDNFHEDENERGLGA